MVVGLVSCKQITSCVQNPNQLPSELTSYYLTMGKSKKKKKVSKAQRKAAAEAKAEREREEAERQRAEDERKADEAIAAGIKVLGITPDNATDLFVSIPPTDDCAICLVALPVVESNKGYWNCCGNDICWSCVDRSKETLKRFNAERATNGKAPIARSCPFCRASADITNDEYLARFEKRFALRDARAMIMLAGDYEDGTEFVDQDERKLFEITLRAVELGNPRAFNKLATCYGKGRIVETNAAKGVACLKASARGGDYLAHFNLGLLAYDSGDIQLALRHYQFSASTGYKGAIDRIQRMHEKGKVSAAEFTAALREYQVAFMAQRSDERVKWAEKKKKKEEEASK